MKLIIDIPEREYKVICENNYVAVCACPNLLSNAIKNGTPIPDNATNGDVIMAMFPNVNVYEHNGGATYSVNNEYNFNATWWNAPYQKGGKK